MFLFKLLVFVGVLFLIRAIVNATCGNKNWLRRLFVLGEIKTEKMVKAMEAGSQLEIFKKTVEDKKAEIAAAIRDEAEIASKLKRETSRLDRLKQEVKLLNEHILTSKKEFEAAENAVLKETIKERGIKFIKVLDTKKGFVTACEQVVQELTKHLASIRESINVANEKIQEQGNRVATLETKQQIEDTYKELNGLSKSINIDSGSLEEMGDEIEANLGTSNYVATRERELGQDEDVLSKAVTSSKHEAAESSWENYGK